MTIYESASSTARRVVGGDLAAAFTLDLDGDKNVWMDGTLTENCTLTLEGLSTTSEAVLLLSRVGGDWTLTIEHGEDSDEVPITAGVTDLLVHARSVDGEALSVAVYEEGVISEGGGGGGGEPTVTPITVFGAGVSTHPSVATASYEISDGFLRLVGVVQIDPGAGFADSWEPVVTLPAACKPSPAYLLGLYTAISDTNIAALKHYGVYLQWTTLVVQIWFVDDVYDSETGPSAPFEVSLHGLRWRLDATA